MTGAIIHNPANKPWSGQRDSNSRPQAWEACALPTELHPHSIRHNITYKTQKQLLVKPDALHGVPFLTQTCCPPPLFGRRSSRILSSHPIAHGRHQQRPCEYFTKNYGHQDILGHIEIRARIVVHALAPADEAILKCRNHCHRSAICPAIDVLRCSSGECTMGPGGINQDLGKHGKVGDTGHISHHGHVAICTVGIATPGGEGGARVRDYRQGDCVISDLGNAHLKDAFFLDMRKHMMKKNCKKLQ